MDTSSVFLIFLQSALAILCQSYNKFFLLKKNLVKVPFMVFLFDPNTFILFYLFFERKKSLYFTGRKIPSMTQGWYPPNGQICFPEGFRCVYFSSIFPFLTFRVALLWSFLIPAVMIFNTELPTSDLAVLRHRVRKTKLSSISESYPPP